METPSKGDIALIQFQFSDLSGMKLRPALVLAQNRYGDSVVCQITSNLEHAGTIVTDAELSKGSLQTISCVRHDSLFTAHQKRVHSVIGKVKRETLNTVVNKIVKLLKN